MTSSSALPLPRVMLLTREIPQGANAGSQQLLRALRDYPADRLLVVGPPPMQGAALLDCEYLSYLLPVTRWINSRFHHWVNLANSLGLVPRPRRAWLREQVSRFKPDLVVSVMDCLSYYTIAGAVARENHLPFMTITMDRPDSFEGVAPRWRALQFKCIGRLYRQATCNLAVSRQMAVWIQRVFKVSTTTHYFAPSEDIPSGDPESCRELRTPGRFVIGYAGSLEYGYERQISALLPELASIGITLRVYSAHANRLPSSPALECKSFLPVKELWNELLQSCDALLLPYPFDHERAVLYRTHFPTKLSEYYTLGLPVFMLGPIYATGIRWGRDHPNSAVVVTDSNTSIWRDSLLSLKQESDLRVRLARESQKVAAACFDPKTSHHILHQHIAQAAQR